MLLGLVFFFALKDGVTPLMVAVHHGFSRAVKVLMEAKPDVNPQDEVKIAWLLYVVVISFMLFMVKWDP